MSMIEAALRLARPDPETARLLAIGRTVDACQPVYHSGFSAVLLPDGSEVALATGLLTKLLAAGDEAGESAVAS